MTILTKEIRTTHYLIVITNAVTTFSVHTSQDLIAQLTSAVIVQR